MFNGIVVLIASFKLKNSVFSKVTVKKKKREREKMLSSLYGKSLIITIRLPKYQRQYIYFKCI